MNVFNNIDDISEKYRGGVLAIGNFDGLHLGHQEVIRTAIKISREKSIGCIVMTFNPHPRAFFSPNKQPFLLSPLHIKKRLMEAFKVDCLYVQNFDKNFSLNSANRFIDDYLIEALKVNHVVIGYDYVFGADRSGDSGLLKRRASNSGFEVTTVNEYKLEDGKEVSSTSVRDYLREGSCDKVAQLLGRFWEISGRVEHGDRRGRILGFPTANLPLGEYLHPRKGVYAVRAGVDNGGGTIWHNAIANFGTRPTFDKKDVLLEAHLFDFDDNLYKSHLRVALIEFLRPEKKFQNIDEMREQLTKDCNEVRKILSFNPIKNNPQPFVPL